MRSIWNMRHKKAVVAISSAILGAALFAFCVTGRPDDGSNTTVTAYQTTIEPVGDVNENASADVEEVSSEIVKKADTVKESETTVKKTAKKVEKYTGPFAGKFMVNLNSEYLNVRASASMNAEIVGKLYVGSGGKVLKKGKKWTKISSGNVIGYVSNEFLLYDRDAEKKANEVGTTVVTVTADSLRVRKKPSTDAGIYGTVAKGETYVGLGIKNGWVSISYEGYDGYISADYVTTKLTVGKAISIEEEQAAIKAEQERIAAEKAEAEKKAREEAEAIAQAAAASKLVETVQGSGYNVSEEDAYLIACVVASEAGYECYEGQLAVANIILNRLASGRFGATVKDVLYASGQFTVVNTDRFAKVKAAGPNETSLAATKAALSGTNNIPGFTSYCASWAAKYGNYAEYTIIGNQTFYR